MMAEVVQIRSDINNENFVLDDTAEVVDGITLAASQGALARGAVLGEISATPGTYNLVDRTALDGSNIPKLLLATREVANIAEAVENLSAYNEGLFDEKQLVFAGGTDLDSRLDDELMPNQADRAFTAPTWANVDINAYDEVTDLSLTASVAAQYCTLAVLSFPTTIGHHYKLTYDLAAIVKTWTIQDFTGAQTIGVISANATQGVLTWTAQTTGGLRIVADHATSSGNFDNFTLREVSDPNVELMPNQVDQDFSVPAWTNVDINAYDEAVDLSLTASVIAQYCTLPVLSMPTEIGKQYKLYYDLASLANTWTIQDFTGVQTIGTIAADATQGVLIFTAETTGGLRIVAAHAASAGNFDNFSLILTGENTDYSMRDLLAHAGIRLAPGISVSGYQNPVL